MIWPFKRKRKIVDRRSPNDFRPGDKVECISANWSDPESCDPEVGDVLTVSAVGDHVHERKRVRCYTLTFASISQRWYETTAFRKIVDIDDEVMVQRIKSAHKPKRVRA